MALSMAHGALTWTTGAAGTTFTVSGLSFQPKAIIAWIMGTARTTDGAETNYWDVSIGFATSTSDRRCIISEADNGAGSAACATGYLTTCLLALSDSGASDQGRLDVSSIASDGFVLVVDAQAVAAMRVLWVALGGSDITNVATGEISEPAATGTQDYTSAGFQPDVVLFAGSKQTSADGRAAIDDGCCFGAADASANQFVFAVNSDDGSGTMDTDRYGLSGECLATIVEAGGNPDARAALTTMLSTGFTLNWLARATTNRKSIYLAIKGGSWKVGTYTIDMTTATNTTSVSGLSFQPVGCLQATHWTSAQSAGSSTTQAYLGLGSFTSTSSRQGSTAWDQDAAGSAAIMHSVEYDQVLTVPNNTPAIDASVDVSAVAADGFTMIVDDASATPGATMLVGYVACGDAAAAGVTREPGVGPVNVTGQTPTVGRGINMPHEPFAMVA